MVIHRRSLNLLHVKCLLTEFLDLRFCAKDCLDNLQIGGLISQGVDLSENLLQ